MKNTGVASLDALYTAFGELRRALDSQDPIAIAAANRAISTATDKVRAHGAWRFDPELRERLETLSPMIESARVRVNLASDDVRQRLSLLARGGTAQVSGLTYGR